MLDQEQTTRLLAANMMPLQAYARAIVGSTDLASEAFQEASVAIMRKAAGEATPETFPAWARGVVRLEALTLLRKRRRGPLPVDPNQLEHFEALWQEWTPVALDGRRAALERCRRKLGRKARELLRLRYDKGLVGKHLAQELGRTRRGVNAALSKAHKALAECVGRIMGVGRGGEVAS